MPASHFALPNSNATYIVACSLSATGVSKRCEDLMASSVGWWFALQTYLSASRRHIESERSEGSHGDRKRRAGRNAMRSFASLRTTETQKEIVMAIRRPLDGMLVLDL